MYLKFLCLFALTFALGLCEGAWAQKYTPEVLHQILEDVKISASKGEKPVVIFDLDETLYNTKYRSLLILREMAADEAVQKLFPEETETLSQLKIEEVKWSSDETFATIGIKNPDFLKMAKSYWNRRFFLNQYAAHDPVIAGASAYVKLLIKNGALIVYLTGRAEATEGHPGMREGTLKAFKNTLMPFDDEHTRLFLKPSLKISDVIFKEQAVKDIAKLGKVLATFENEPGNSNMFKRTFPEARAILLDTGHSPHAPEPHESTIFIADFVCPQLLESLNQNLIPNKK